MRFKGPLAIDLYLNNVKQRCSFTVPRIGDEIIIGQVPTCHSGVNNYELGRGFESLTTSDSRARVPRSYEL